MGARTDTRRLGVVDGIPLVARRAFRGAVGGATDPGLRHAIVACATICCDNKPHMSAWTATCCHRPATQAGMQGRTNTRAFRGVHSKSGIARSTNLGAMHRTIHANFRDTILACARICYAHNIRIYVCIARACRGLWHAHTYRYTGCRRGLLTIRHCKTRISQCP